MAEKINDNILLASIVGVGIDLFIATEQHNRLKQHWHWIRMHQRHEILKGLKLLHHGLWDFHHGNDKNEGLALIEEAGEKIQRAEEFGFPRPSLFRPHPRTYHIRKVGHIVGPHGVHPIHHTVHSHHTPIQYQAFSGIR